jgi:hypothetical protein
MAHAPAVHDGVPLTFEHAISSRHVVPHVAVEFKFVSQPSFPLVQSAYPVAQLLMPQAAAVHDAVPFAFEQATRSAHVVPHVAVEVRSVSQSVASSSQFAVPAPHDTQAPLVHVWLPVAHVSTGVVETKSAPHATRVIPWQTTSPGFFPVQSATTGFLAQRAPVQKLRQSGGALRSDPNSVRAEESSPAGGELKPPPRSARPWLGAVLAQFVQGMEYAREYGAYQSNIHSWTLPARSA